MTFNTALSGLSAASADLQITGNNIANASTVGFKASRAQFADVYASTLLGSGSNQIGTGVKLANVAQLFDQGTISFTNNSLDLSIDGSGFFILNDQGSRAYTRAGMFGVDDQGYVVATGGSRVQGFSSNGAGVLSGILGDLRIQTSNLAPERTTLMEATLNLDAREPILSRIGTTISTTGSAVGVSIPGLASPTASILETAGSTVPFDYSINQSSSITAGDVILPFDFGVNQPSAVTGTSTVTGFDFSLNTPSTLTASSSPLTFNFADKASAISGTSNTVAFDYSGANNATFDVTIAGSSNDGTANVNLNTNIPDIATLITTINGQLGGVGVQARINPSNANQIQFISSSTGENSVITVDSYVANGTATLTDLTDSLSGIASGAASIRSSFDVTVAGGSGNGTVTVSLVGNLVTLPALIADIQDQLGPSGVAVDVRQDPNNAGRLQFFSTDNGVASTVTVGNYQTTDVNVSVSSITNLLRLSDGATSSVPGAGAIGTTGSFTQSSFDVTIAGGSGPGGSTTTTVLLNQNVANGDVNGLVTLINNQFASVPLPGIDVRAQEDPTNPGRIQIAATVAGEASTVTVDNFVTPTIAGDVQATSGDIQALLGGVVSGATDNSGINTNATFQVALTGSSVPSENQTVSVTLDTSISTLQDLIVDIRNDLVSTGIGLDVREDPNNFGRLQFYSVTGGEASTITVDPNDNATYGNGVTQANVEAVLGDIVLGLAGSAGSSNTIPNPFGGTGVTAAVGNRSSGSFDLTVAGAAANNGTVTITLGDNIQDVNDLITDIRDDLAPSGIAVDVREDPANAGQLQFFATVPGEASTITISNLDASNIGVTQNDLTNTLNLATGVTVPGIPGVDNGYAAQSVDVVQPDGTIVNVSTLAGDSASQIAAQFSGTIVPGVTATASTTARIPLSGFSNVSGNLQLSVNGVALSGATLDDLSTAINTTPGLGTVSASIDAAGDLVVVDQVGNDLIFDVAGGSVSDSIDLLGDQGGAVTLTSAGTSAAAVGGSVDFTLDEGVTMSNPSPASSNLFGLLDSSAFAQFQLNTFDSSNQETYNAATSATIFDSLGNPHVMSLYFVKERFTPGVAGQEENRWTMYTLIDGQDVGDPDPNLAPPANSQPTRASYTVQFERDGTLNPAGTDPILISNWIPLDATGSPNGAVGPQNLLAGGVLPVPDPPTSSNFEIRLGNSTQFGSGFALNQLDQNGYTSGELSGLSIDEEGLMLARFTNGQSLNLGQIAIADFSNAQGLKAVGNTAWIQTNDSGEPTIGSPGSGSLGAVTSGALEDSNVELSEQLVQLLIAQRNFQANARTISTADEITQTIINL